MLKTVDAIINGRWARLLIMGVGPELKVWEVQDLKTIQLKWTITLEGDIKDFAVGPVVNQGWQLIVISKTKNNKELEVNAYHLEHGFQQNRWFFGSGDFAQLILIDTAGLGLFSHIFVFASQQKVGVITIGSGSRTLLPVVMPKKWAGVMVRGVRAGYQLSFCDNQEKKKVELDKNVDFLRFLHTTFDETGDCSLYLRSRQLLCSAVEAPILVDSFFDFGLTTYYFE